MTVAELELKTQNFIAGMDDEDLEHLPEVMEDILDAQAYVRARQRLAASGGKTVSWEDIKAKLERRFPGITEEATS